MDYQFSEEQKALIDVNSDSIYLHNERCFFVSVAWPEDAYTNHHCVTTIQLSTSSKESSFSRWLNSNNYNWFPFAYSKPESLPAKTIFSVEVDEFR